MYKYIKDYDKENHEMIYIVNQYGVDMIVSKDILIDDQNKEIERLNNIINEFDKWLLGEQMMFYRGSDNERLIRYGETKFKWLELKGDSSNG